MRYKINLLNKKKESAVERIIYFALNYLRYVLVFTQILVIWVFFYRLKTDQEIIDLQEKVTEKNEIIQAMEPLFKEARAVDLKINESSSIIKQQNQWQNAFSYFLSTFPDKIYLSKLELKDSSIIMDGRGENADIIKKYYLNLKKESKFKNINLKTIEKSDLGFEFTLELSQFSS
jgi:Tfp pilus assembly protein PilN